MKKRSNRNSTRRQRKGDSSFFSYLRNGRDGDSNTFLAAALPRSRVTHPRSFYPHPLDLFEPSFCKQLNWVAPHGSGHDNIDSYEAAFVAMVRADSQPRSIGRQRAVAVDGRLFDPDEERANLSEEWSDFLNIKRTTDQFADAGLPIWRRTGLDIPLEQTAFLMRMDSIDAETAAAVQSSMFMAAHSSAGPVDMEAISFSICSFIHAHPYFDRLITRSTLPLPYGDDTLYVPIERRKTDR